MADGLDFSQKADLYALIRTACARMANSAALGAMAEAQAYCASDSPRFYDVSCSQCGRAFGPGNHGYSHCDDHKGKRGVM